MRNDVWGHHERHERRDDTWKLLKRKGKTAMNNVILTGKLTCDPEVRHTAGGMAVATFCVEAERPGKDGPKLDRPKVTVLGKQAENCQAYTGKGLMVAISGHLETRMAGRDGEKRGVMELIADRVKFLEWKSVRR